MKRRAVVFAAPNRVEIEEIDVPRPGPGELLLEAECTLISPGTERMILSGDSQQYFPLPARPGYSFVGTVHELGAGVEGFAIGDRVIAHAAPHASHVVVAADTPIPVRDGVDSEAAAFFNLAQVAQLGLRRARIEVGDPVAVVGQGPVGLLAVQLARLHGACPVIALDIDNARLERSRASGADVAVNARDEAAIAAAFAELDGGGPAAVLVLAEPPEPLELALRIARNDGRVVLASTPLGGSVSEAGLTAIYLKGLELVGASVMQRPWTLAPSLPPVPPSVRMPPGTPPAQHVGPGMWTYKKDAEIFLRLLGSGALETASLISHRFDYGDAARAYELVMARDPELIGAVLRWR